MCFEDCTGWPSWISSLEHCYPQESFLRPLCSQALSLQTSPAPPAGVKPPLSTTVATPVLIGFACSESTNKWINLLHFWLLSLTKSSWDSSELLMYQQPIPLPSWAHPSAGAPSVFSHSPADSHQGGPCLRLLWMKLLLLQYVRTCVSMFSLLLAKQRGISCVYL